MQLKQKAAQIRRIGSSNSNEDSMLAHISPLEAMFLKARGGSGRTDPQTGLPHFDGGDGGSSGGDGGDSSSSSDSGSSNGDAPGGQLGLAASFGAMGNAANSMGNTTDVQSVFDGMDPSMVGFDAPAAYSPPSDADQQAAVQAAVDQDNPLSKYKGIINNPVLAFLSKLSPLTNMAHTGLASVANQSPGPGLGLVGATIGSMIGGPVGGMLGAYGGNALGGLANTGQSPSSASPGMASPGGQSGGTTLNTNTNDSLLGGLAGLYLSGRNNANTQDQINNINGLYGPNSAYAAQLQKQLEARDAAAGRRSQYGPRSVELQAALAGNAAKLAPTLQSLYTQKNNNTNLMLSTLLKNTAVNKGLNSAGNYLGNLFNSNTPGEITGQTFANATSGALGNNYGNAIYPGMGDGSFDFGGWGG